ncbi:MAG: diphosphomevalonate decarboxylase [Anaerolineales bacterium]|jgi:diphosphomevalonate decarboxylase
MQTATAIAHPNIAFIKYWGNRDHDLRLPCNGSISMNLGGLFTRTKVTYDSSLNADQFSLNGSIKTGRILRRVKKHLNHIRAISGLNLFARIYSENNFPIGAGIASSASAFAALTLASTYAAGLRLSEIELSRIARLGSGSACRSVPSGFVEWQVGTGDSESYAHSIASPDHWELTDLIVVVAEEHKSTGSTEGHKLADTSVFQSMRVSDTPRRLNICRNAIFNHDFDALAKISEIDCIMMHAVMMTSTPALFYWLPTTVTIINKVRIMRQYGMPIFYTIDAGPNVHVICPNENEAEIKNKLSSIPNVKKIISSYPGGKARIIE